MVFFFWNHVVSSTIGSNYSPKLWAFWGWNCLVAPPCSTRGWKFLKTESFSGLKVSQGWKFLRAESVFHPQDWKFLRAKSFSGLNVSGGWNFLRAESVFHPQGWKFLKTEIVSTESVSRLKVSFGVRTASFLQLKMSWGWKCLLDLFQFKTYKTMRYHKLNLRQCGTHWWI